MLCTLVHNHVWRCMCGRVSRIHLCTFACVQVCLCAFVRVQVCVYVSGHAP